MLEQRKLQVERSKELAEIIVAVKKECWRNSMLAFMTLPELRGGYYVEGFAVPKGGIPVEHGWIEVERVNSNIVEVFDTTFVLINTYDAEYFPGLRFTWQEAQAFWDMLLPRVRDDGHGGWSYASYRQAHDAAARHVFGDSFFLK